MLHFSGLLLSLIVELVLLITAWGYLGDLLRGSSSAALIQNLNGYYFSLLVIGEKLNALFLTIICLYLLPLIGGLIADLYETKSKAEPFFKTSLFYLSLRIFVIFIQFGLNILVLLFLVLGLMDLQGPLEKLQFQSNLSILFAANDASSMMMYCTIVYGVLLLCLNVELFGCVYLLGWHNAFNAIQK